MSDGCQNYDKGQMMPPRRVQRGFAGAHGSVAASGWTQTPPDRNGQGYWWWWNGDDTCAPSIITVMYSGMDDKCFVCQTNDPQARNVDDERWSGWWKRIQDEQPPNDGTHAPRKEKL
jgi:hypothetical protein